MEPVTTTLLKSGVIFAAKCPALNKRVILFKETFEKHILPNHPQLWGKESLIREAIKDCRDKNLVRQKIKNPSQVSILHKCPNLRPWGEYLRVAIQIKQGKDAIVTSALPVHEISKEGVRAYEPCE